MTFHIFKTFPSALTQRICKRKVSRFFSLQCINTLQSHCRFQLWDYFLSDFFFSRLVVGTFSFIFPNDAQISSRCSNSIAFSLESWHWNSNICGCIFIFIHEGETHTHFIFIHYFQFKFIQFACIIEIKKDVKFNFAHWISSLLNEMSSWIRFAGNCSHQTINSLPSQFVYQIICETIHEMPHDQFIFFWMSIAQFTTSP